MMLETLQSSIIQLVQINQPFMQRNFLPYAAGLLQAYSLRHAREPWRYTFLPPLYERLPMDQAVAQARLARVVGFSVYVWNINYSLELAARLKAQQPETLIIFGGPQVPDRAEDFLRAHPFIDVVCHGEGEQVFLALLEACPNHNWSDVPGISWLDEQDVFQTHAPPPRIKDLDLIPSPYLLNLFEPLLRARPGDQWQVLWETNRGCPFSCSFCDWGSATASKVNRFGEERLKAEAEWFGRTGIHLIWCCDANYGMLKRDLDLTEKMVEVRKNFGAPKIFFVQSAKNVTERTYTIQKMLSHAGLSHAATLSMQSTTPDVLKYIQRENISVTSYRELQQRFQGEGVPTYTDILIGLPGESYESFKACVAGVIEEGQHHLIRYYNTALLPNAEIAQPDYLARHGLEAVKVMHVEPMAQTDIDWPEYSEIVIASQTLSRLDWRRSRALAWWTELLYFNRKLLQLPLLLLHSAGLSFADMLDALVNEDVPGTVIFPQIRQFMLDKASRIQQGDPELIPAKVPGKGEIWLTMDDYLIMGINQTQAWPQFYAESLLICRALLQRRGLSLPSGVLEESLHLSARLLEALMADTHFRQPLQSNLWQVYQAALKGEQLAFKPWQGQAVRDWTGMPFYSVKLQQQAVSAPA